METPKRCWLSPRECSRASPASESGPLRAVHLSRHTRRGHLLSSHPTPLNPEPPKGVGSRRGNAREHLLHLLLLLVCAPPGVPPVLHSLSVSLLPVSLCFCLSVSLSPSLPVSATAASGVCAVRCASRPSSSLLLSSLEFSDTQSLSAINTSPPRNRFTFL